VGAVEGNADIEGEVEGAVEDEGEVEGAVEGAVEGEVESAVEGEDAVEVESAVEGEGAVDGTSDRLDDSAGDMFCSSLSADPPLTPTAIPMVIPTTIRQRANPP
jgi:hypothetical protein